MQQESDSAGLESAFVFLEMRFTHDNARGATVHDLESGKAIDRVKWVDTDTGTVCWYPKPGKLTPTGRFIQTRRTRFERIWPIWAGQKYPVMFQCMGRK